MNGVKTRFEQNKIYTNINSLLIGARMPPMVVDAFRFQHVRISCAPAAMNPYQRLPIYNEDAMARYKEAAIGSLPTRGSSARGHSPS